MRKNTIVALSIALVAIITLFIFNFSNNDDVDIIEQKREKHRKFLAESPFNDTKNLSKDERKKLGLPPNAYNERLWELTMNPDLGYPTPFLVDPIDVDLLQQKASPGSVTSPWIERGPLSVGGRTRVVFFDPNDVGANNGDGVDYNRVFAGGVGGGLWVNDDIEDEASSWKIITGVAANLTVSSYAIDPNNSNIFYIGTGEQYTRGAAIGTGLYKSIDGGVTWTESVIPPAGAGDFNNGDNIFESGIFFINDIAIRDVNGSSELYVAVGASQYLDPNFNISDPVNSLGYQSSGLYRSVDDGFNWSRIEDEDFEYQLGDLTLYYTPNDFEISANNNLVMGTINTLGVNQGGGRIFSSTDGISWDLEQTINGGDRIEIAASTTDENKFYVLGQVNGRADIFLTDDGFNTLTQIAEPEDVDLGIPDTDFTRGQSFYDLVIEVDPENDNQVYVGGINMHRSRNSGSAWTQLSKWSNNPNMNTLDVPFVHADIHAIMFKPGNSNQGLVGSDGGVSYVDSYNRAARTSNGIDTRNLGYNVTQFYYGDVNQIDFQNSDSFVGGTQDNGSPIIDNSVPNGGLTESFDPTGGDGSYSAIDDEGEYAILGYTGRTHIYLEYPITNGSSSYFISNDNDGDFINVAELDSRFDILYANSLTSSNTNSITACNLEPNSATCNEISGGGLTGTRATAMKALPFDSDLPTLYVGTQDSKLLRINNANSSVDRVITDISSTDFLGSVSDIEFGASEQEIFVTFHNYGVNNVWYSNDGGTTWSQKDGNLPDIPVKAILQNPLNPLEVIIGTEQGVFSTADFDSENPTWTVSMNGMTNVKVYDLDLRTADNTVLATTHGRGMFTGKFTAETASISSETLTQAIKVYPTQVKSEIFISSDQNFTDAQLTIYNLNGQEVYRSVDDISNNRQRIDVSSLSSGLYFLKAKGNGLDQTTKFLKE